MNPIFSQLVEQFQLPLQSPILIFALILSIILLIPLAFEKIKTPDIIGLILCGVAIGPHGFNILEQDLFVDIFSTIGLMYIMFLAGLEINLVEFKFNRNKSFVFALFTFLFPFAIGIPVCFYLLDLDIYATLLVASIFATHTLITYPIVNRFGINTDRSVAITVGGTIITDSVVLIILAMILGAHDGELSTAFWLQLAISLALFSAIMFVLVPRIAKAFFHKMAEHQHAHYIFVMVVVFLSAFLAEVAGLEGIIGAFAAGLALNKYIPSSSALMNRTAFIGNSLFIPFFLISVGMLVDVKVIASGFGTLIVAAALTVAAFAGKYLAARATQLAFHLSRPQGSLIFGLSSAHAAATLAVVLVGFKAGIVDEHIINAIVMVILASCVISSFITEAAARKMTETDAKPGEAGGADAEAIDRELGMEQILVPLSNIKRSRNLLYFATLVKDKASTHPLAILNVVPNTSDTEKRIAEVRNTMEKVREEASGADVEVNVLATMDHSVAKGIARMTREIAADLILINSPVQSGALASMTSSTNPNSVLYHTDKVVFICNFQHAVTEHGGIFLILPQFTEFMPGFGLFLDKIVRLSTELSVAVKLRSNRKTFDAVQRQLKKKEVSLDIDFVEFNAWQDFFVLFRKLDDLDLLIMASGRRGTLSHHPFLDDMPARLERHFPAISKILVYP